jgi:hypothetical protein
MAVVTKIYPDFDPGTYDTSKIFLQADAITGALEKVNLPAIPTSFSLNSITAATASNTINNVNNIQEWQWNSLTEGPAFIFSASNAYKPSGQPQVLFNVHLSGAAGAGVGWPATIAMSVINDKSPTSTTASNVGIYADASGNTYNYPFACTSGGLGIYRDSSPTPGSSPANVHLYAGASGEGILQTSGGGGYLYFKPNGTTALSMSPTGAVSFALSNTQFASVQTTSGGCIQLYNTTAGSARMWLGFPEAGYGGIILANYGFQIYNPNRGGAVMKIIQTNGNMVIQEGGTYTDRPSARLQVNSSSQGFLPPRLTTAQKAAISSPAQGLILFDTDLQKLCVYCSGGWETITSS